MHEFDYNEISYIYVHMLLSTGLPIEMAYTNLEREKERGFFTILINVPNSNVKPEDGFMVHG